MSRHILFLAHRIPWPPDKGDKIRSFHWLDRLARRHPVRLACFVDDPADLRHLPALRALCADVVAVPLDRATKLRRAAAALMRGRSGGSITAAVYHDAEMWQAIEEWRAAAPFDAVFAFSSAMAPYAMAIPAPRRVIDLCDCDSRKWLDYAEQCGWPMAAVYRREARVLRELEQECLRRFDAVCVVNQREARALVAAAPSLNQTATVRERRETLGRGSEYGSNNDLPKLLRARVAALSTTKPSRGWGQTGGTPVLPRITESGPGEGWTVPHLRNGAATFSTTPESRAWPATLHIVPNGVDCPAATPLPSEPRVGFVGALDYRPNVDGLMWFVREVWPRVRRERPDAEFHIIGRAPVRAVRRLSGAAGVRLIGPVEELSPHYRRLRVCVAPLHIARGVQNKVLEAMAHGRPVVATSCVAAGLDANAGEHLIVADDAVTFAKAVARLLEASPGRVNRTPTIREGLSDQPGDTTPWTRARPLETADRPVHAPLRESPQALGEAARAYVLKAHQWSESCNEIERLICSDRRGMPLCESKRSLDRVTAQSREGIPA